MANSRFGAVMNFMDKAKVVEDDDQYYVYINAKNKNRAKSITGRIWDPTLKCWKYPKKLDVYLDLRSEFANDDFSISPPPSAKIKLLPTIDQIEKQYFDDLYEESAHLDFSNAIDVQKAISENVPYEKRVERLIELRTRQEQFGEIDPLPDNVQELKDLVRRKDIELQDAKDFLEGYEIGLSDRMSDIESEVFKDLMSSKDFLSLLKVAIDENNPSDFPERFQSLLLNSISSVIREQPIESTTRSNVTIDPSELDPNNSLETQQAHSDEFPNIEVSLSDNTFLEAAISKFSDNPALMEPLKSKNLSLFKDRAQGYFRRKLETFCETEWGPTPPSDSYITKIKDDRRRETLEKLSDKYYKRRFKDWHASEVYMFANFNRSITNNTYNLLKLMVAGRNSATHTESLMDGSLNLDQDMETISLYGFLYCACVVNDALKNLDD
jgi:hypothetical protein